MDFQTVVSPFWITGPTIFNKCSKRCGEICKYLNEKGNLLEVKVATLYMLLTTLKTTSQQNKNFVEPRSAQTFHDKQHSNLKHNINYNISFIRKSIDACNYIRK